MPRPATEHLAAFQGAVLRSLDVGRLPPRRAVRHRGPRRPPAPRRLKSATRPRRGRPSGRVTLRARVSAPAPLSAARAAAAGVGAVWRGARALSAHRAGIATPSQLASPSLARAPAGARRDRALERYARRAAFRATPHGLLAGVCMGTLADADRGRDRHPGRAPRARAGRAWRASRPRAARRPGAARAHAAAHRAVGVARRRASSAGWARARQEGLHPEAPFDEVHEAELVEPLPAILAAAERWAPWPEVRAAARTTAGDDDGDDDADELLLTLLDDGLLQSDLAPPIIGAAAGRAPARAARRRSASRTPRAPSTQANAALARRPARARRGGARLAPGRRRRTAASTPCWSTGRASRPRSSAPRSSARRGWCRCWCACRTRSRHRPPNASRSRRSPRRWTRSPSCTAAGAFDVAALATGDYGVELHGDDDDDASGARPTRRC